MGRNRMVGGVLTPLTPAEEDLRDAEEKAWADGATDRASDALRMKRNQLLADTDWWILRGSPTDAQTAYRKALRDLPANTTDPTDITWPTVPS